MRFYIFHMDKFSAQFSARENFFLKKHHKWEVIDTQSIPLAISSKSATTFSNLRHKSTIMPKIRQYYII